MGKIIEGKNLTKFFGEKENQIAAVDHVDLEIEEGEYVAVVGASGSGKSTLLHLIGGLEKLSEGELIVCGQNMDMPDRELSAFRKKHIGVVFQQFHLFPQLTVYQNIILPVANEKDRSYEERALWLMEFLGIEEKKDQLPGQLSGGQQQRVAIARALITDAPVILADEPTGNLDSVSAEKVKILLEKAHKELGKTLIVVTHDREYANRAERKIQMADGQKRG